MKVTVARTIGYTLLIVFVNFLNKWCFGNADSSFIAMFMLGSFVGEIGLPPLFPKAVLAEKVLVNRIVGIDNRFTLWHKILLIISLIVVAASGLILTSNAMTVRPSSCTSKF